MAIERELWSSVINENLYKTLETIIPAAFDDSELIAGKTVHIPNAGAPATISKNPTLPLTAVQRTDVDHTYTVDTYAIAPSVVKYADTVQLSYDKLASVINDITQGLPERIRAELTINWYTDGTYKVLTSGSSYGAHAPGATGNRKGLTTAELKAAAAILDAHKVPDGDRYLLVDTVMFYQLLDELGVTTYRDAVVSKDSTTPTDPIYGFRIIKLPTVAYCTSAYAIRDYGNAGATTDHAIALAVHKSALSFAVGDVQVFEDEANPMYLGSVISGAILAGGKYRRSDKKGVVPIIQATTS